MQPPADDENIITKAYPELAGGVFSATKAIESTMGRTTPIGQNSWGVMGIGKGIPELGSVSDVAGIAEYYRLQHERQITEARIRKQQHE